jgi:ADP-ribose pyrophosphatase YjhB (NUDIX family)
MELGRMKVKMLCLCLIDYGCRRAFRLAYPIARVAWRYYRHDGVLVAVWAADRLLVVRHSYKPGLGMPGGGIKSGEHHRNSVLRELREEVGVTLNDTADLTLIGTKRFGHDRGVAYFYEVRLELEPHLTIDRREIIYAEFLAPAEIMLSGCDRYFADYLRTRNPGVNARVSAA